MDTKVKATKISSGRQRLSLKAANLKQTTKATYHNASSYFAVIYIIVALSAISFSQNSFARALSEQSSSNSRGPYNGAHVVIVPNDPVFLVKAQSSADKTLVCRSEGDNPASFSHLRWAGPGRTDNWEELRKKHNVIQDGPNSWELEFINPTTDDSGTYYCIGLYQNTENLNASIVVKVVSPIKLENCPERQFLVKGRHNPTVTCQISADQPKVTIWKDSKTIDQYNGRYRWGNNDGLVINGDIDESDAGRYTIKVRSDITGDKRTQTIDVEVHTKPEIAPYNGQGSEFSGVEGKEAILNCTATGNPKPLFSWLSPQGKNLTQEGGYIVNPEQGTLQINKVNVNLDKGDFQCKAYNDVGDDIRKVSMTVYTPPRITLFTNQTVAEDGQVTFECRAKGYPEPNFSIRRRGLNQSSYRWGDGVVIEENITPESGTTDSWVYRLKVLARRSFFGTHYCNATNLADTAEASAQLFVGYKPDLSQTPPEQFRKLGKEVVVTCHIKAYPAPTVTWYIDNTQVLNAITNVTTSADGQTHIITMMPPNSQQVVMSKFRCRAQNEHGFGEQEIITRITTAPDVVVVTSVETTPTTAVLHLSVPSDGGDRIRYFKYFLEGKFNSDALHSIDGRPISDLSLHFKYPEHRLNETIIDASLKSGASYTVRNLYPLYKYRLNIKAVNSVGEGGSTDISFETKKPLRPEPPVIIKTGTLTSGIHSDYSNGYLLRWSPPELDNGDPVISYVIKYNRVTSNALGLKLDEGQERVVEQMNERPLRASIGPLEPNQSYRIQIQAKNKFGESEADSIIVLTAGGRHSMPEFEAQTLAWLTEQSTPTLIAMLLLATILLIIIDLTFCVCFQIGLTHTLRKRCAGKTGSVVSDKNFA